MPVPFAAPPTPGTATPGDLYVDLQTRALWLAVDAAVDPAQFVLISDIEAMLANDAQTLTDANAYTDAVAATKADLVHDHVAADVTDFDAAVTAVVAGIPGSSFAKGMVMMYSGPLTDIGTGDLAGWALCDGQAAPTLPAGVTPNLKDRFVIGAGNLLPGDKNAATANIVTDAQGAHTHTVGDTALTVAMLPSHNHGAGSYSFSDTSTSAGAHTHGLIAIPAGASYDTYGRKSASTGESAEGGGSDANLVAVSESAGAHTHAVSGPVTGTSSSTGSGATHTHTLTNASAHQHNITAAQVRAAILWYALAYIVKI